MGGAGSFAAIGARIAAGKDHSRSVGWIVDMGYDFPEHVRSLIASWETHCVFREDMNRQTTKGWNGYEVNEKRGILPWPSVYPTGSFLTRCC